MPTSDRDDDLGPDAVEVTIEDVAQSFATLATYAWSVSPYRTVLGLSVALEALAYRFVQEHPEHRAAVLAHLQRGVENVADGTGARH